MKEGNGFSVEYALQSKKEIDSFDKNKKSFFIGKEAVNHFVKK